MLSPEPTAGIMIYYPVYGIGETSHGRHKSFASPHFIGDSPYKPNSGEHENDATAGG
jgi:hypothetical protein